MGAADLTALLTEAFGAASHPLARWYGTYLTASGALQTFTAAHAAKIRKKLRGATSAAVWRDLRCELAVAVALAERRSALIYEPMAAQGRRGPDFLLKYKGHTDVYVEVTRLRAEGRSQQNPAEHTDAGSPNAAPAAPRSDELPSSDTARRIAGMLCGKLGQFAAGAANLLVLVSDAGQLDADALAELLRGLRRRAAAQDDAYFAFRGLPDARAFLKLLPRLSAIVLVAPAAPAQTFFVHPQARHPLPTDLARAARGWDLGASIGPDDAP